jgi:dihydrofolate reductase
MRLVVVEFMTLDGVMEAHGYEEHRTGRHGWAMEVGDPELQAFNGAQIQGADALLFGRTTYNVWAAFWPTAPDVAAEIGAHITRLPKYVVSKTLRDQDWANTHILRGDLEAEVRRIKDGGEGNRRLRQRRPRGRPARAGPRRRAPDPDLPGHPGERKAPVPR